MVPLYRKLRHPPRRLSAVERRFADWDTLIREWAQVELHRQLSRRGLTVETFAEMLRRAGPDVLVKDERDRRLLNRKMPGERTPRERRIEEAAYRRGLADAYAKQQRRQSRQTDQTETAQVAA